MDEKRLRALRLGRVIGGVLRQAVVDAAAPGVVILEDWSPEGELAYEWAVQALGEQRVWRAAAGGRGLTAHPASKTVLLLPPEVTAPLLPLGDLYASQVEALAGSWSAPAAVQALAARAGGIAALDAALQRWLEERRAPAEAFTPLGPELAAELLERLERSRAARWRPGLVPKLGSRTLGVDLYE
ncbi:MAG: hypothetical protein ACM32J_00290 [Rhizobacter sp.]